MYWHNITTFPQYLWNPRMKLAELISVLLLSTFSEGYILRKCNCNEDENCILTEDCDTSLSNLPLDIQELFNKATSKIYKCINLQYIEHGYAKQFRQCLDLPSEYNICDIITGSMKTLQCHITNNRVYIPINIKPRKTSTRSIDYTPESSTVTSKEATTHGLSSQQDSAPSASTKHSASTSNPSISSSQYVEPSTSTTSTGLPFTNNHQLVTSKVVTNYKSSSEATREVSKLSTYPYVTPTKLPKRDGIVFFYDNSQSVPEYSKELLIFAAITLILFSLSIGTLLYSIFFRIK